mmetsp:Transcript_87882/g.256892  ORF Transcript_87882/g.256892 Transcript_87882/m.256892 type:complete len:362 (-) Transcript_87882:359-1444(-)
MEYHEEGAMPLANALRERRSIICGTALCPTAEQCEHRRRDARKLCLVVPQQVREDYAYGVGQNDEQHYGPSQHPQPREHAQDHDLELVEDLEAQDPHEPRQARQAEHLDHHQGVEVRPVPVLPDREDQHLDRGVDEGHQQAADVEPVPHELRAPEVTSAAQHPELEDELEEVPDGEDRLGRLPGLLLRGVVDAQAREHHVQEDHDGRDRLVARALPLEGRVVVVLQAGGAVVQPLLLLAWLGLARGGGPLAAGLPEALQAGRGARAQAALEAPVQDPGEGPDVHAHEALRLRELVSYVAGVEAERFLVVGGPDCVDQDVGLDGLSGTSHDVHKVLEVQHAHVVDVQLVEDVPDLARAVGGL